LNVSENNIISIVQFNFDFKKPRETLAQTVW